MKCFLLLTILAPGPDEEARKPVNIDLVGTIATVKKFDGRPVSGSMLSFPGRGFIMVRESYAEIFKRPCIPGTGGTKSDD